MIEIVFTCAKHIDLVNETHRQRDFPVFWLVDAREVPCFDYIPDGVALIPTSFPRGGNLNGRALMKGYIDLLKKFPREVVIKRDSDTIIENPQLFLSDKALKGVAYSKSPDRVVGCAYAMNVPVALPLLEKAFKTQGWFGAEDKWISEALKSSIEVLPHYKGRFVGDAYKDRQLFNNVINKRLTPIQ